MNKKTTKRNLSFNEVMAIAPILGGCIARQPEAPLTATAKASIVNDAIAMYETLCSSQIEVEVDEDE